MRARWLILVLAALVVTGCVRYSAPQRLHETRTFPASAGKLVQLDLGPLDVEVTVAERSDIELDVDLEVSASSSSAARRWIERRKPIIEDAADRLEVSVPRTRGVFMVGTVRTRGRVRVTLPAGARLEVRTASGDVSLGGGAPLSGTVRIRTASGDVRVDGGARELVVKTASGDVECRASNLAKIQVETASGEVDLRRGGGAVQVDTASGDVDARGLEGELSAHSTSGDVRADWTQLPPGTRVNVHTTSGDVTLRIPGAPPPAGLVETTSGEIRSEFEGRYAHHDHTLELAGAGPRLEVATTSGDVDLGKVEGASAPPDATPPAERLPGR